MKRVLLFLFLILFGGCCSVQAAEHTTATYVIDAEKNAFEHNNKGIGYVQENDYYAAIQEFKIAISLNPKTQATSVYFNNLGNVYMKIGYPDLALDCYRNALTQYSLNFEYYKNLVSCYKALNQISAKLEEYKSKGDANPLDKIMLGLLYEEVGDIKKAIIILDEFVMSEPGLLITPAVKYHIQELVEKIS